MFADLIIRTILTIVAYFCSNYHTYHIGILQNNPPLQDCLHDILPDWSRYPYTRDILLPLFLIPLCFVIDRATLHVIIFECWDIFLIIVTLKAITIFFTFIPPSNQYCHETRQLNHTYHQMFSGHNSFVLLLVLMYIKHGLMNSGPMAFLPVLMYSIVILMTRCHYTIDVIVSYIIVILLV